MRIIELILEAHEDAENPLQSSIVDVLIVLSHEAPGGNIKKAAVLQAINSLGNNLDEDTFNMLLDGVDIIKSHDDASIMLKSPKEMQEPDELEDLPGMEEVPLGGDEFGGEGDPMNGEFNFDDEDEFGDFGGEPEGVDSDVDRIKGVASDEAQSGMDRRAKLGRGT